MELYSIRKGNYIFELKKANKYYNIYIYHCADTIYNWIDKIITKATNKKDALKELDYEAMYYLSISGNIKKIKNK